MNKIADFVVIHSLAKKLNARKRAKGGLAILYNKKFFNYNILFTDENFLIVNLSQREFNFVILNTYNSPYADDIVIVTEYPHILMRILKALHQYCTENQLVINTDNTKIFIFRKNPRKLPKFTPSFFLGDTKLKIVKSYKYLGVIFLESGVFRDTLKNIQKSAISAQGAIYQIIKPRGGIS